MAPTIKRKHERLKVMRRREVDEPEKEKRFCMVKCGICKAISHNRRSCPNAPINLKRKRHGEVFLKNF